MNAPLCLIQINGKTRLNITVPKEIAGNAGEIEKLVRQSEGGQKWLSDKPVRKLIVAKKGELVNFVIQLYIVSKKLLGTKKNQIRKNKKKILVHILMSQVFPNHHAYIFYVKQPIDLLLLHLKDNGYQVQLFIRNKKEIMFVPIHLRSVYSCNDL